MNARLQLPGWTNAFTQPIRNRVDMLTTGIGTPIGIKVYGADLTEIERVGTSIERVLHDLRGTRSVGGGSATHPDRGRNHQFHLRHGDVSRQRGCVREVVREPMLKPPKI